MAGYPYLGTFDGSTWTDAAKDIGAETTGSVEGGGLIASGGGLFVEIDVTEATTGYLLEADDTLVGSYPTLDTGTDVKSLSRDGGMVQI